MNKYEKFNHLYEKYHVMWRGSLNKYKLSKEDREDICQNCVLYLWKNIDLFDINGKYINYQMKILPKAQYKIYFEKKISLKSRLNYNNISTNEIIGDSNTDTILDITPGLNDSQTDTYSHDINNKILLHEILNNIQYNANNTREKRDIEIVKEYFKLNNDNDLTYDVLAEKYNLSKQGIKLIIDKTLIKLKKILSNNNINELDDLY